MRFLNFIGEGHLYFAFAVGGIVRGRELAVKGGFGGGIATHHFILYAQLFEEYVCLSLGLRQDGWMIHYEGY